MSDVTFDFHGHRINLRVGAIVRRGDEIVLCRNRAETWWYLPGGRLKAGEDSLQGIKRELNEELGSAFEIVRPIVSGENFYTQHGATFHEVCFYYEARWTGGQLRPDGPEINEEFIWLRVDQIGPYDVRPKFMKPFIATPPSSLQLIISRQDAR